MRVFSRNSKSKNSNSKHSKPSNNKIAVSPVHFATASSISLDSVKFFKNCNMPGTFKSSACVTCKQENFTS